jgi:hypothetical protein
MAKYSRFDSRNKKRNNHKNRYLDRTNAKGKKRQLKDDYTAEQWSEKYSMEKAISIDLY